MVEKDDKLKIALIVLGIAGASVFVVANLVYWMQFRANDISDSTADWGQFGDYLAGTVGPLVALFAFIGLLWTIRINERELRYTRAELKNSSTALQQNNEISQSRAKHEQLESQKADIYRIIQPITEDIEKALNSKLNHPANVKDSEGVAIEIKKDRYEIRHLANDALFQEHVGDIVPLNSGRLQLLGIQLETLEKYLRAYERLAGDDFYTGYYKPRYQKVVRLLYDQDFLDESRRQDVLDYFQSGIDVLKSAEKSIAGSMSMTIRVPTGSSSFQGEGLTAALSVADRFEAVVVKEMQPDTPRELPHVSVHTYPKPNDPDVRLAIVSWAYAAAPPGGVPPTALAVEKEPMSHEEAMERGMKIAKKYRFPILYWQEDA